MVVKWTRELNARESNSYCTVIPRLLCNFDDYAMDSESCRLLSGEKRVTVFVYDLTCSSNCLINLSLAATWLLRLSISFRCSLTVCRNENVSSFLFCFVWPFSVVPLNEANLEKNVS